MHIETASSDHTTAFFGRSATGLGTIALASLTNPELFATDKQPAQLKAANPLAPKPSHFPAKAKRVIYMHMAGSPSQLDLFDPKPKLIELNGPTMP